jgi:hypothetical protein
MENKNRKGKRFFKNKMCIICAHVEILELGLGRGKSEEGK